MRRDALGGLLLCVVTTLASLQRAHAQQGLEIEAGNLSYTRDGSVMEASGGVRATWDGSALTAQTLRYEREADRLFAHGSVTLDTPDALIAASSCTADIEAETAELTDVKIQVKDGLSTFGGTSVRKHAGLRFEVEGAYFTTCELREGGEPDWSVTGERAAVEVDGYGTIRDAAFRVRGVPVLYTPVLPFPAITNRHSGFLLPTVGASNRRGFIYKQPLFWAIDKHQDLTVTTDIETSARVGLGLEYRYRPSRETVGAAQLYYFNEAIRTESDTNVRSPLFEPLPGEDISQNRAIFDAHHRQRPSPTLRFYADTLLVSDDLVLRETDAVEDTFFARETLRTLRYTSSRLGVLSTAWAPPRAFASYGYQAAFYQDLVAPDRYTVQEPGRLWMAADGDLPLGLGWQLDSHLATFARTEGDDGQRVDLNTTLQRPLVRRAPVKALTWARVRVTGYRNGNRSLLDVSPPQPPEREKSDVGGFIRELDRWAGRAVGEAGVDFWTGFARAYRLGSPVVVPRPTAPARAAMKDGRYGSDDERGIWGAGSFASRFSSVEHTIEPFSSLRWTDASDQDELPLYDGVDRIDSRTTFTYGTASRFLFADAHTGHRSELAQVSIAQSYDVSQRVVDDHFSDIDTALNLLPTRHVTFSGLASYNVGTSSLRGAAATLGWRRFRLPFLTARRSEIEAAYRFVRHGAVETAEEGLETLEGRTILAITDTFSVGMSGRYDLVGDEFVESGGGIRLESSCRCWTVDLGVLNTRDPKETQFRVEVDLGGLGSLGSSALRHRTAGLAGFRDESVGARRYGW